MTIKKTVPDHLSKEAKAIYNGLAADFQITDMAGLRILRTACESFDRATKAREQIDRDGMTYSDATGKLHAHPLIAAERDSRAAFLAGLKALHLDLEPIKPMGRPPNR